MRAQSANRQPIKAKASRLYREFAFMSLGEAVCPPRFLPKTTRWLTCAARASVIFTHRSSSILPPMNTDVAAQRALDRLAETGLEKLSDSDKILASIWTFEAGVANRGFASYFSSSAGEMAFYVPTALKTIGATGVAQIAARPMKSLAPAVRQKTKGTTPACSCLWRCHTKTLTNLESQFYDSPEDVDDLLELYLGKKQ